MSGTTTPVLLSPSDGEDIVPARSLSLESPFAMPPRPTESEGEGEGTSTLRHYAPPGLVMEQDGALLTPHASYTAIAGGGSPVSAQPITVSSVCVAGTPIPVEVVWCVELPASSPDFNVDVALTNGISLVIPHSQAHDRQWLTVARDSASCRRLIARFEPEWPFSTFRTLLTLMGSPFASDTSTLIAMSSHSQSRSVP